MPMDIRTALHESPMSLAEIARRSGMSPHTIRSYSIGRLVPPPASLEKIRDALRTGGAECIRIADELDSSASLRGSASFD
jgi:transcriptional regulator with XRE-family HTH domain